MPPNSGSVSFIVLFKKLPMNTKSKLFTIGLMLATVAGGSFVAAQSTTSTTTTTAPTPAPATGTMPGRGARGGMRGRQPHMEAAMLGLQEARRQLELALPDKGGNREKAIASVDKAIEDVKAGIEYARTHPEEFPGRGGRGARGEPPAGTSAAPASSAASS
jgi:hypothetical protein